MRRSRRLSASAEPVSIVRSLAKTAFAFADLFGPPPSGPRVLIYHQVGAGLGRQMEVTPEAFRYQMSWLAENRQVVSLPVALERWSDEDASDLVVLTFDDGYLDTYQTAFPLLQELAFPFTIYLATESIETGRALGPSPEADPLTWDMMDEMISSGLVTVGAHTHTHRDLRTVGPEELEAELETSDRLIEVRLGSRPDHFAYPWGYWAEPAHAAVKARYQTAVLGGTPSPQSNPDPLLLHRYPVQLSDTPAFFRSRLQRGLRLEEWTRRKLSRYDGP